MRKALSARKVSAFFANDALTTLPHSQNGNALTGLVLLKSSTAAARRMADANCLGTARPHDIEKPP